MSRGTISRRLERIEKQDDGDGPPRLTIRIPATIPPDMWLYQIQKLKCEQYGVSGYCLKCKYPLPNADEYGAPSLASCFICEWLKEREAANAEN